MPALSSRLHAHSSRRQMPVVASSTILFPSDIPQLAPEQALWIQVLRRLHEDLARGQRKFDLQLTEIDKMQLDFVAMAIGLPTDTLPRLMRAGREEFRQREEGRKKQEVSHVSAPEVRSLRGL